MLRKLLFYVLTIVMISCSSDTSSDEISIITPEEESTSNQITLEKDLLKMTGDGDHWLNYENERINKAWSKATTYRSQMVYNSNGTMSREYRVGTGDGNSDNENFEWEIPVSENYIENIYENGKLISIIRHQDGSSWKKVEYTYQGDLVVEKRRYFGEDNSVDRYIRYEYNNQNELVTIVVDESPGGGSSHTLQVTFDDKVNPYYKIWKETKLTFWDEADGLTRYNLEFYPYNVLNIQASAEDIWVNAYYTYDEDNLPITMHINEGVQSGRDYYFEYQ